MADSAQQAASTTEPTGPSTAASGQSSNSKRTSTSGSTRQSSSKRLSSITGPKPPTSIHPTAIIAGHAVLTGTHTITIGPNAVVHPYARLVSLNGPVILGAGSMVWEGAVLGVTSDDCATANVGKVEIGRNVSIESGALVEASYVGDGTIIEANAKVGTDAVIGKHCKIAPDLTLPPGSELQDFTVLYQTNRKRRDATLLKGNILDVKTKGHERHIEVLKKLMPNHAAKWQ